MNDRYLLESEPLIVNRELACAIGLNNSIVLRQIFYWISQFEKTKNERHYHNSRWWVFNSYAQWQEDNFPFWHTDTIRGILNDLEELRLVLSDNFNRRKGDNTKWYTINWPIYDMYMEMWRLHDMPPCSNGKKSGLYKAFMENYRLSLEVRDNTPPLVILSQATYDTFIGQLGNYHTPLPEITQESNTEENTLPATQATQDVVSKKRQPKTPKPVHPLNQRDSDNQNPYHNLILLHSFTCNPNSKADQKANTGKVVKILSLLVTLYDEIGGFTVAQLETAYIRVKQEKGQQYMATDPSKVYNQLSPHLRRLVTENNTVPAAPVVKPRPDITPRVGTRRLDALQPLMPRKENS